MSNKIIQFVLNLFICVAIAVVLELLLPKHFTIILIINTLYYFTPAIAVLFTEKDKIRRIFRKYKVNVKELNSKRAFTYILIVAFAFPLLCLFWVFLIGNTLQIDAFGQIIIPKGYYTLDGILIPETKLIRFFILYGYSICLGLIACITYNMLFALGGEIAWRGFLGKYLPFGYVKKNIIIGLIWGTWFLPVIFSNPMREVNCIIIIIINYGLFIVSSFLLDMVYRDTHSLFIPAAIKGILISFIWIHQSGGNSLYYSPNGIAGIMSIIVLTMLFHIMFKKNRSYSKKRNLNP